MLIVCLKVDDPCNTSIMFVDYIQLNIAFVGDCR